MIAPQSKLRRLSDHEIVLAFRQALLGVLPVAIQLECLEDDTQPYDDYDEIAEALWRVLVERSLALTHDLAEVPRMPKYGMYDANIGRTPWIAVECPEGVGRFVEFIGDRSYGTDRFNAVGVIDSNGANRKWPLTSDVRFTFRRE